MTFASSLLKLSKTMEIIEIKLERSSVGSTAQSINEFSNLLVEIDFYEKVKDQERPLFNFVYEINVIHEYNRREPANPNHFSNCAQPNKVIRSFHLDCI